MFITDDYFNISASKFGAMLDMLTDRLGLNCFFMVLRTQV